MATLRSVIEPVGARELRAPGRDALRTLDGLVEQEAAELFVLTEPEGDVELCVTGRHEIVVFVYTGMAALFASCGLGQPWRSIGQAELADLVDGIDAAVVFAVNVWHPQGARYPEPDVGEQDPLEPAGYALPIDEVWIPALPVAPGAKTVRVELFGEAPDSPVLLAYSSLAELRRCCGPHQAAVWVPSEGLGDVATQTGACEVRFDIELADELRRARPVVDWTLHTYFE